MSILFKVFLLMAEAARLSRPPSLRNLAHTASTIRIAAAVCSAAGLQLRTVEVLCLLQ
jgi:hypothetical protein